jgi:ribosomal protein S18 acetylase RimI-like enzyme
MTLRPATEGDVDAVAALGVLEEAAWFGAPEVGADEVAEWIDDEGGIAAGVVAVDDDGQVRGFASPGQREAVFLADPARIDALADELLPWLRERRGAVELMTFAGDTARVRAFERHGLRHHRSSFSMVRAPGAGALPAPEFPAGVEVAPYRLGDDDEAVHRMIYVDAAWASVPGHAERDLDSWRGKERPCRSLFLARRDGRPVGWVSGRVLESGRGYISTLAVAGAERGRGLGRALLLHAFADLQAAGVAGLGLDVVAHNESALGLYRSVGLEIEREWRVYADAVGTEPRSGAQRRRDTEHRLRHDVDLWVASASTDGAPYLVPLSFDWDGERLLMATPADSPTGRNLAAGRTVRLGLGPTRDVSMIDGDVEVLEIGALPREVGDRFAARTGFDPRELTTPYRWFRVAPRRIQAWREADELAGRELMRDGRWIV